MIKEIRFSEEDACKARTFTLQGQKVLHPTKPGLYLTGGKVIAVTRP